MFFWQRWPIICIEIVNIQTTKNKVCIYYEFISIYPQPLTQALSNDGDGFAVESIDVGCGGGGW